MNCEHYEHDEPDCEPEPDDECEVENVNIMFIEDKEPVWSFWPWLIALFLIGMLFGAIIFGHGKTHHDPVPIPCPTTTTTTTFVHASSTSTVPTTMPVTN